MVNDMSQDDAAEKLMISKSYIRAIETGEKKPSKRLLKLYSIIFDVNEEIIITFDDKSKLTPTKKFLFDLLKFIAQ